MRKQTNFLIFSPVGRVPVAPYPSGQSQILAHESNSFGVFSTSKWIGKEIRHEILCWVLQGVKSTWLPLELLLWDISRDFPDNSSEWRLWNHEAIWFLELFDIVHELKLFVFLLIWSFNLSFSLRDCRDSWYAWESSMWFRDKVFPFVCGLSASSSWIVFRFSFGLAVFCDFVFGIGTHCPSLHDRNLKNNYPEVNSVQLYCLAQISLNLVWF